MNSIDEQIRKALAAEDQKAIDEIDEEAGLFEMIGMSFKGKQAWLSYYMYGMGMVIAGAGVYFLFQYFATTDIKNSLSWGLAIIACMLTISMIKIMAWQQMQKIELMREIKRLEMRVMMIAERDNRE